MKKKYGLCNFPISNMRAFLLHRRSISPRKRESLFFRQAESAPEKETYLFLWKVLQPQQERVAGLLLIFNKNSYLREQTSVFA